MLEVRLIGTFEVKWEGKTVTISSRTAQSLFAYLILNAGTSYRREKLAGMFWPDAPEEKARAYLRHELWRLRQAIPSKEFLLADGIGIAINSSTDYWLDSEVLDKLKDDSSVEELKAALLSYGGDLLPGFYDEWIVLERERLQAVYEQKIARLLELLEIERRWNDILEWAERWISFGQGPEAAYQYLMIAYNELGDRVKVNATYQRCVKALRELDLEPSEQTRELASKQSSKIHIPIPLTSFIGREKELKEIASLFSKSRLITLTGSGGVGKTRLAIQVVSEVLDLFPDGVWFLDLAPLSDSALIPNTLAALLGLRESRELSVTDMLVNYFRTRTALVIFDNCEHLIESCAQLAYLLLTSCEKLSILATSRETLQVSGETSYRVPSLEFPKPEIVSTIDDLEKIESSRLFVDRAVKVSQTFSVGPQNALAIAQICRRLDGIPLAIELAAAHVDILQVKEILKQLNHSLDLLANTNRTILPKHQTMRASLDWSWELLTDAEKIFMVQLSVFAGGWTLESAQAVCDGDCLNLIRSLVRKSLILVYHVTGQETRYRFHEMVHQYTREKLVEVGEEANIRTRHLKYFLQFTEQKALPLEDFTSMEWDRRLSEESDNIRAALEWANKTDVEMGLYLSGSLGQFWENLDLRDGSRWLAGFLHKSESRNYPHARAKALCTWAALLLGFQEFDQSRSAAQECLDLYRACGDKLGEIDGLLALGSLESNHEALTLAESLGDRVRKAQALVNLAYYDNDYHRRVKYMEEAIAISKKWTSLESALGPMIWLGNFELANGNLQAAQKWADEVTRASQSVNNKNVKADGLHLYGNMALVNGDYDKARTYLDEAVTIWEGLGFRWGVLWTNVRLGYVALREGNLPEARNIFTDAAQEFQKDQFTEGIVYTLEGIAGLYILVSKADQAACLIGWTDAMRKQIDDPRPFLEQADVDKIITACLLKIGEEAFSDAYDEGQKMTPEEAISFAIQELQ